jgi:N,N'-diacetylchitobiose transport system substrate-binding protein
MFETADDKDLAFTFLEMMTTGEFAEKWGEQSGYFPGQKSLLEASIENADPMVVPFATQMVEGGASVPVTPTFGAVQAKKTTSAMMQAILSGQKDIETAAADAAAEMTATLNGQ